MFVLNLSFEDRYWPCHHLSGGHVPRCNKPFKKVKSENIAMALDVSIPGFPVMDCL